MSEAIDLSIVVATYGGTEILPNCLASIEAQEIPDIECELIVVDGIEREDSPIVSKFKHRRIYRQPMGNIDAVNYGVKQAEGKSILFVADDVRLRPGCLNALWQVAQYAKTPGLLQPVLIQPNGDVDNAGLTWIWPGYGLRIRRPDYDDVYSDVPVVANTCWLAKKASFLEFDVKLGISHEDVDLCLRMAKAGYKHYAVNTARATHLMGQTIGRSVGKPLSPFYHQARLQTIRKNYSGLNRMVRTGAVQLLDAIAARRRVH